MFNEIFNYEEESTGKEKEGTTFSWSSIIKLFKRRWWLILGVIVGSAVLTALGFKTKSLPDTAKGIWSAAKKIIQDLLDTVGLGKSKVGVARSQGGEEIASSLNTFPTTGASDEIQLLTDEEICQKIKDQLRELSIKPRSPFVTEKEEDSISWETNS